MQFTALAAVDSAVTHSGNKPGCIGAVNFGNQLRLSRGRMEVFYEDLARQICVSVIVVASQDHYLGRCTVCLVPIGLLRPVCLSITFLLIRL
jgi:hypothetical protein